MDPADAYVALRCYSLQQLLLSVLSTAEYEMLATKTTTATTATTTTTATTATTATLSTLWGVIPFNV